jgi:hypothetical protein
MTRMMPIKTTPLADYPIVNASLTRVVDTVLKRLRSGYAGCDPGMTIPETYQTGFAHITTINPLIMRLNWHLKNGYCRHN